MTNRACDACRRRKVKCDGTQLATTCSNCRMSGMICRYDVTPGKRGPKSRRRLQSRVDDRPPRCRARPRPAHSSATESVLSEETNSVTSSPTHSNPDLSIPTPRFTDRSSPTLNGRFQRVHEKLILSLSHVDKSISPETVVARCVDVFMESVFCLHPIVHECSIRTTMNLQTLVVQHDAAHPRPETQFDGLHFIRSYALVTALCAATTYLLSPPRDFDGSRIGPLFLQSSRDALSIYHDLDLKRPESSSLAIRMFQAAALHSDGKHELAYHLFGEAMRLADQMRLYDERSYEMLDPLEGRLCRMAFWSLTTYAQYHHIIEEHSLAPYTWGRNRTVSITFDVQSNDTFEKQLFVGFFAFHQLWEAASGLLLDLESYVRLRRETADEPALLNLQQNGLTRSYVQFLSVLDDLPAFINNPDALINTKNTTATTCQRRQFWIQRTNIFVAYHCLRMILVARFSQLKLGALIGIQDSDPMLTLRKTEIAHDMVFLITSVPLDVLRVSGETCIAQVRHVGATLLEIMNQVPATPATIRANSLFPALLDILARLDSRASEVFESRVVSLHSPDV